MTHDDVRRKLSAYLEDDLALRDEAVIDGHLAECPGCAAELRALRRTLRLLHELPAAELPRDLAAPVLARLRAEALDAPRRSLAGFRLRERASFAWLAPLAAACGIAALGWLGSEGGSPAASPATLVAATEARPAAVPPRVAAALIATQRTGVPNPATPAASLPSIGACLEASHRGSPAPAACARWYSWFVAMALEDARGFVDEVERLPVAAREPWLRRVSEFAAHSGSAPLVGAGLRSTRDPRAASFAARFEHGGGARVQPVGWPGR